MPNEILIDGTDSIQRRQLYDNGSTQQRQSFEFQFDVCRRGPLIGKRQVVVEQSVVQRFLRNAVLCWHGRRTSAGQMPKSPV